SHDSSDQLTPHVISHVISSVSKAIICVVFAISIYGCRIGWQACKRQLQKKRRERLERKINNLTDIHRHNELLQISSVDDHFNEKNLSMDETNVNKLSTNKLNEVEYISMPLSVQLFNNSSDKNELEQIIVQDSICPQQTTNKEEEDFPVIVPVDNVKIPSHIN
ncbi:unnamed protein product, partial [Adineta steineri]